MSSLPVTLYDYTFSPYAQKIRYLLHLSGVDFQRVDQPPVLPRPDLESLGITYRRIPVVAVGKDVYCDSSCIVKAVQRHFDGAPRAGPADRAFEDFAARFFGEALRAVPARLFDPSLGRDRETRYPVLARPDFATLRPSALGGLASLLGAIEHGVLGTGAQQYIGGAQPRETSGCEAAERAGGAGYADANVAVPAGAPLGIPAGARGSVEDADADAKPGAHPQLGPLVGLARDEAVVGLENGIRLHFPRAGYIVRARQAQ